MTVSLADKLVCSVSPGLEGPVTRIREVIMQLGDIGIVCGICASLLVPAGSAGKYWADHEYVSIAAQNLGILYAAEDELAALKERPTCDANCIARKATLEERIRNLKK